MNSYRYFKLEFKDNECGVLEYYKVYPDDTFEWYGIDYCSGGNKKRGWHKPSYPEESFKSWCRECSYNIFEVTKQEVFLAIL